MAEPFTIIDDLRKQQLSETGKLAYFMLGAAGSAIAFAFHETADRPLQWSLAASMAAIVTWAISFGAGIRLCEATSRMIGVSHATASKLLDRNSDGNATALHARYEALRSRGQRSFNTQLWALLAGALLYGAGHVWHLIEETERSRPVKHVAAPLQPAAPPTKQPQLAD